MSISKANTALICAVAAVALAAPASAGTYQYLHDDGSVEGGLVPALGDGIVFLNNFVVENGFDTITSIEASWVNNNDGGLFVTAGVWSDPNQDGDPSDGVLLGVSDPTLAVGGADEFQIIDLLAPVDVGPAGTSFFVGLFWYSDPVSLAIGVDFDYDVPPIVSWYVEFVGMPPDPNDLSTAVGYDQSGAFTIRANAIRACREDLDGNGSVGAADLLALLASWGPCKGCPADFDGDGNVGASDLLALLANWGPCP